METGMHGTDLTKDISVLLQEIRYELVISRGKLEDITRAYPGIKDHVDHIQGLLTCGISCLYTQVKERQKIERLVEERKKKAMEKALGL